MSLVFCLSIFFSFSYYGFLYSSYMYVWRRDDNCCSLFLGFRAMGISMYAQGKSKWRLESNFKNSNIHISTITKPPPHHPTTPPLHNFPPPNLPAASNPPSPCTNTHAPSPGPPATTVIPASSANVTHSSLYAPGWNHTAGIPISFAVLSVASVAAGGVMKLSAVFFGSEWSSLRERIVV